MSQRNRLNGGFTLVEVLVVIIILGVLATVAYVGLTAADRSANVRSCQADFAAVEAAVTAYRNDTTVGVPVSLDLYKPDGASPPTGSLPDLGYMEFLKANDRYTIVLQNNAGVLQVGTVVGGTTATTVDGCSSIR